MRRLWLSLATSAALAAPAFPATVLSRQISVVIDPSGRVTQRHALRIRMETESDRADWSPYPILADENRKVEIEVAAVERPDGSTAKVEKKALDTIGLSGAGVLHESQRFRTISFPDAPVGSVLVLSYRVEIRPYFPADTLALLSDAPTEDLDIRISGGGPGFRFRVDGSAGPATVTPVPGGVTVRGRSLAPRPKLDFASKSDRTGPILRYGWGEPKAWEDVGEWYLGLLADVARGSATVRQEAISLRGEDDRATIARLLQQVRSKVRYVAVEVGIGGYRPHPPEEVRSKSWGDCKDKATLLIDMLAAVGIEAFPVLILASTDDRVDTEFPSADQFNHMIVAVSAERAGPTEGLPVASGYLFLDPTQESGGLSWVGGLTQGQDALVVRPGKSTIVRTPRLKGSERGVTDIQLAPSGGGGLRGKASINFRGDLASYLLRQAATRRPEEFRGEAESLVRARVPGGEASFTGWTRGGGEAPDLTLAADVSVTLAPSVRRLVLPARPLTPPLSVLENRDADVVLDLPASTTTWRVTLPPGWCAPKDGRQEVENEVGLFRQKVASEGSVLVIERHLEIIQPWISKAHFPQLKEIILAEHRAHARSLRFDCAQAPQD